MFGQKQRQEALKELAEAERLRLERRAGKLQMIRDKATDVVNSELFQPYESPDAKRALLVAVGRAHASYVNVLERLSQIKAQLRE